MPSAPLRLGSSGCPRRRGRARKRRSISVDSTKCTCQGDCSPYLKANLGKRTSASRVTAVPGSAPPPPRGLGPASAGARGRGQPLLPRRLAAGGSQARLCGAVTQPPPAGEARRPECGSGRGAVIVPGLVRSDVALGRPPAETLGGARAARAAAAVTPPICGCRACLGPILFFIEADRGSVAKVTCLACTTR